MAREPGVVQMAVAAARSLAFDPGRAMLLVALILLGELVLNLSIVWFVPYTEIDWEAYMDEVEGVINGTYNYALLRGGTGPLV